MTDEETPIEVEIFSEAMNGIVGKATEAVILVQSGGDVGLAAAMGGAAGGTAKAIVVGGHRFWVRRQERLSEAFVAAEAESGRTRQELFELALDRDNERGLDLFIEAFRAAAREANLQLVRAYGRLAASGITTDEPTVANLKARILSALSALDEADLEVLLHVARRADGPWFVHPQGGDLDIPVLVAELPHLAGVIDPVVSRLVGLGLLVDRLDDTSYADAHVISAFARLCVQELMRGSDAGT